MAAGAAGSPRISVALIKAVPAARSPRAHIALVQKLMRIYLAVMALEEALQLTTIVVMTRFRLGL